MKTAIRIVLTVGILLALGIYFGSWWTPKQVTIPPIDPGPEGGLNAESLFAATTSRVSVTVQLPFDGIRELAQKSIPEKVGGEIHVPDTGGISGIVVRPNLARETVQLNPVMNSDPAKINLSTNIHGRVNAKAFKWIIANVLVGTIKTKSPEMSADIDLAARINGWIAPGINPDWRLTHQEHFDITVDKGQGSTLWGIIHFDAKAKVQELVNDAAPGLIAGALDSVAARVPIRSEVEKIWNELHKPIKVSNHPIAYSVLKPERLRLQKLAFDNPNILNVRIALDTKCATLLADEPPKAAKPEAFPALVQEQIIDPGFHVIVPLALSLPDLNRTLADRSEQISLRLDPNSTVDIQNISFYAKDGLIYLKAALHGKNDSIRTEVDGDVFLQARIVYDESAKQIRFQDVAFELRTRNTLQHIAAWLLNDMICRKVQESVAIDVSKHTDELRQNANAQLSAVRLLPGVNLNTKFNKLSLKGLEIRDRLVLLSFDLAGEATCDILPSAFNLKR